MGMLQIAIAVIVFGMAAKFYNGWKHEAQQKGIALAELQISKSAAASAQDSLRASRELLAERDKRTEATVIKQTKRKAEYAAQIKSDPVYTAWANCPVPDAVIDELCARTDPDKRVRGSACDLESRPAMQPKSAATPAISGWPQTQLRNLGPRIRQHFN